MPQPPTEPVFRETQPSYRNAFILSIIICESMILTAILGAFAAKASGAQQMQMLYAWIGCVVVMPGVILSIRLRTRLDAGRLRVWFPPFPGWKIDLGRITDAWQRTLSPMGDLGGWGYKITRKHGHVMNMFGEQFITLTLDNGKKRTIGTQRPEELLTAIRVLAQLPPDESEHAE